MAGGTMAGRDDAAPRPRRWINPADGRTAPGTRRVYGALHDVEGAVGTHLFGIAANNSGSSFLQGALATSRATWNLATEGQHVLGFAGPIPGYTHGGGLIWSVEPRWLAPLTAPGAFDWPRTRRAWYFQAYARQPAASVFYTKSPQFMAYIDELARHFANPKFLFMVRNPYAVCEAICRDVPFVMVRSPDPHRSWSVADLPTLAARHVANCLALLRRNVEVHGQRGVFFTYEAMCADPEAVEEQIRALVPALDDLQLRQRLPVKGRYHEMLIDMNARQIARLKPAQIAAFNRVFREHRDLFDHFGYEFLEPGRWVPRRRRR